MALLQPLRRGGGGRPNIRTKSFIAPTGGWFSLANVLAGKPGTATSLINFMPKPDTVDLRGGWKNHSDTASALPIESLFVYNGFTVSQLFCASGDTIFDVSNTVAAPSTVTGLTNPRVQTVNYSNSGGHFLYLVNGSDLAKHYDGTTWVEPAITGLSSDTFDYVAIFKSRLYFVIKNSLSFAFLPVDSIAGVADEYEMGNLCSKGGHLVAMETWTIDGGNGPDDYLVCLTSQGQAVVFSGSDPADVNNWAFVGVYDLPAPIGKRCMLKVGSDIYIITAQGVIPLSKTISLDRAAVQNFTMTKNIAPDVNRLARIYSGNFGWEIIAYPRGTMAILNVPIDEHKTQYQLVMNTITGAWTQFRNQNANCWALFNEDLYFGGNDGIVRQADCAGSDGGADIIGDIRMTDDSYGSPAAIKYYKMIRANVKSDGAASPRVGLNIDFADNVPTGAVQTGIANIIKWDQFNWDEANWPPEQALFNAWQMANCNPGYTAAFRLRVSASGGGGPVLLQINGFDVTYEMGGTL
jgi:hypothetical protein